MNCDYLPLLTKVISGLLALAGTFYLGHRHGRSTAKPPRTPRKKPRPAVAPKPADPSGAQQ